MKEHHKSIAVGVSMALGTVTADEREHRVSPLIVTAAANSGTDTTLNDEAQALQLARNYATRNFTLVEAQMLIKSAHPELSQSTLENIITQAFTPKLPRPELTNGGVARYCLARMNKSLVLRTSTNTYMRWSNGLWVPNYSIAELKADVRGVMNELIGEMNEPEVKNYRKWLDTVTNFNNVVEYINIEVKRIREEQINVNPYLLGLENGVYDLELNHFRGYRPEDYIINKCTVGYDEEATCSLWEDFIYDACGNLQDRYDYLQMLSGYLLTGENPQQHIYLFLGNGRNGKSTYVSAIAEILGNYATTMAMKSILKRHDSGLNDDLLHLRGKRLVTVAELESNVTLDSGRIKAITGGDHIAGRRLYGNSWEELKIPAKIILLMNDLPIITDTSDGFWSRIKIIPFDYRVPLHLRNTNLLKQLRTEYPGVLNWMIQGYEKLMLQGGVMTDTNRMIELHSNYRSRFDPFIGFLETEYALGQEGDLIRTSVVRDHFNAWMRHRNKTHGDIGAKKLKDELERKGVSYVSSRDSFFVLKQRATYQSDLDVTSD